MKRTRCTPRVAATWWAALAGAILFGVLAPGGVAHAALVVTNGDFEADDVPDNSEGSTVDITSWFEGTPTAGWYEWIKDSDGLAGGAGNNYAAFSGNSAGAAGDLYIHQSIGTLDATGSQIVVSGVTSDRGDRAGTGRHAAIIQVGLWYDDGSATLADMVNLEGTAGLTQIGAQTVGASVGGTYTPQSGSLDIDLTTLDPAGQTLSEAWTMTFDAAAAGASVGDTVYLQIRYFDSDTVNSRSEAFFDDITVGQQVPEPATAAMVGLAGLALIAVRRRK